MFLFDLATPLFSPLSHTLTDKFPTRIQSVRLGLHESSFFTPVFLSHYLDVDVSNIVRLKGGKSIIYRIPMQEQTDSAPSQRPIPLGRVRSKLCEVRGCHSNSLRNPELLFVGVPGHSFPERRFVWLALMQAARDKKRSYVCSLHFKVRLPYSDKSRWLPAVISGLYLFSCFWFPIDRFPMILETFMNLFLPHRATSVN